MGAMLGSGGGGGGGGGEDDRDDSMLPSFGGTGFGGLAAAPLLSASAPTTAAAEPVAPEPQRSQAPLYAIIAILVLGLGGLAAFVLTRPPPQPEKIVERVIQAAPVPVDKNDKDDDDDKKKDDKADKEEDGDEGAAAEAGDAAVVDDKKGTTKKTDKKGTAVKTDVKKDAGKTDTKADEPVKKVDTKPKEEDISVECLLDPSKCKKGGGGGGGGSKPPPDSGLPEKLELADIKAGTDPTKAAAKSNCAGKAKGGEKVKIKLSIAGPSGNVLSSTPEDDGGNAPLAQCVAAELKKSSFKKVQKEQIGTVVSVSF